jgi:arylsulfatase A-like enzyme
MRGKSLGRRLSVALLTFACVIGGAGRAQAFGPVSALPNSAPNIVVFYVDDVAPHDGSLWNDASRTPYFVDRFINHGITFPNAIGEDPLCCPGRGGLLTGLHTHNHGVMINDARLFDPSEHIGKAMQEAGYASFFLGKYLNDVNKLTPAQWQQHDAGWTQLDVINSSNGRFMGYRLHTKQGEFEVKGLHSTNMVGQRLVMHMQETPASQPIFAIASIYDMHGPNTAQATDRNDPRCDDFPAWKSGSYNEADVSDKPAPIGELPLMANPDGWPMEEYCREMLGVDRTIGMVVDELRAEGRLNNTLLVFTADNGVAWGEHRLGQHKIWPYATPVPLYMSWPAAGWGRATHRNSAVVSNIDLAPTFCDLAQSCVLGPFRWGVSGPDGKSLAGLLNGSVPNLGRDAVLEDSYVDNGWSWFGLRTTPLFDANGRWHYVEYLNGFRELYDLVADPWELNNLATSTGHAALMATLHARLAQLRMEGVGSGKGSIRIIEDERPQSGYDYSFTGDLGAFQLDDDANATLPDQRLFANLDSGYYTITRSGHSPWVLSDIACTGVRILDREHGRVTMLVHAGEYAVCTFVDAKRRPDATVALQKAGPYKKNNLYQTVPTAKQTVRRDGVAIGSVAKFRLRAQNDSLADDDLMVQATTSGPPTMTVRYFFSDDEVTKAVVAGKFAFGDLIPNSSRDLRIEVTVGPGTPEGSVFTHTLTVRSASNQNVYDVARAIVTH